MNVNRMLGSLKRKRKAVTAIPTFPLLTLFFCTARDTDAPAEGAVEAQVDTPEANALRNVVCLLSYRDRDPFLLLIHAQRLFCESGGPNGSVWLPHAS